MKKIIISSIIIFCVGALSAVAASSVSLVKKGNRLYREEKYDGALKDYAAALSKKPDSALINFDLGTAQFKLKDYDKAAQSFEKSLLTEDKDLERYGNYNLGNARYMSAEKKENSDLEGAVKLLEGAVGNYQRVLAADSKNADAKFNYEAAQKKLKELREKLKKQPPQKNKCPRPNKQNQGGQQKQNQEEQNKPHQEKQQEEKSQQNKAQQEEEKKEEQPSQDQEQKNGEANASKDMSKDEAKMLLEEYKQEERGMGRLDDQHKGEEEPVSKDW
jgi:hypothetical protein